GAAEVRRDLYEDPVAGDREAEDRTRETAEELVRAAGAGDGAVARPELLPFHEIDRAAAGRVAARRRRVGQRERAGVGAVAAPERSRQVVRRGEGRKAIPGFEEDEIARG